MLNLAINGALIPQILKKVLPRTGKMFRIPTIDAQERSRIIRQTYPPSYRIWYAAWMIVLVLVGISPILLAPTAGPALAPEIGIALWFALGGIGMFATLTLINGIISKVLWLMSSPRFHDYIQKRLLETSNAAVAEHQINTLIGIGIVYTIIMAVAVGIGALLLAPPSKIAPTPEYNNAPLSRESARAMVIELPEVTAFFGELEQKNKGASINIEDWGDAWGVQVFESVGTNGTSHTATFNWYRVDKKTATITSEF